MIRNSCPRDEISLTITTTAAATGFIKTFCLSAAHQQFHVVSGLTSVNFNKEQKMQVQLVDILTQENKIRLMSSLTGFHVQWLSSLQTPHAISWATGFSTWFSIPPEASRAALKWALGCKIADTQYVCQWCNKHTDGQVLLVSCQGPLAEDTLH